MRTLLGFLLSVTWISGVQTDPQLVQPEPSVVVKPGASHTLTCTGSGYNFGGYGIHWVRQVTGGPLQWLAYIRNDGGFISYLDSVKGRFTITRDNSKSVSSLKMDNMKPEDTAVYYCARGYFDIWGPGTFVTVSSVSSSPPVVFPLIPCCGSLTSVTEVTIGCLSTGYFPTPVDVTWNSASITSGTTNFPAVLGGNGAYSSVSTLGIPASDFLNPNKKYICTVEHKATSTIINKEVKSDCSKAPESPTVQLMQGSCHEANNYVELTGQVYNLTTQDANIKWLVNGKERSLSYDLLEMGKCDNKNYCLQVTVSINKGEWNNGVSITIRVTDPKTGKSAEATIRKCSDNLNCLQINVYLVPPSTKDILLHNTAPVRCLASNLPDANDYSFRLSNPGATSPSNDEDPQLNNNGTYTVTSVITLSTDAWEKNTEVTCVFNYRKLSAPIIVRISKPKETRLLPPRMILNPPSAEQIARKELLDIFCMAYGYNPAGIFMSWTINDLSVSEDQYVNSPSIPESEGANQTYFMISKIQISATVWDNASLACIVGHEAIPAKFMRKTIDKLSGNAAKINLSINMSDTTLSCQ